MSLTSVCKPWGPAIAVMVLVWVMEGAVWLLSLSFSSCSSLDLTLSLPPYALGFILVPSLFIHRIQRAFLWFSLRSHPQVRLCPWPSDPQVSESCPFSTSWCPGYPGTSVLQWPGPLLLSAPVSVIRVLPLVTTAQQLHLWSCAQTSRCLVPKCFPSVGPWYFVANCLKPIPGQVSSAPNWINTLDLRLSLSLGSGTATSLGLSPQVAIQLANLPFMD